MKKPFAKPITRPTHRATKMATGVGITLWSPQAMIPHRATVQPTDRSMPPVRMTMSIPMLMRPFVTTCREILRRFLDVKNVSRSRELTRNRTAKIARKIISDERILKIVLVLSIKGAVVFMPSPPLY
jgi:hypothetical protein